MKAAEAAGEAAGLKKSASRAGPTCAASVTSCDPTGHMDDHKDTTELFAQLKECLSRSPGDDSTTTSKELLVQQGKMCDRVLRICVKRMGQPGVSPAHATTLVAMAREACHGYLTVVRQPPPLYLEKILYHLLRNAAHQHKYSACWMVADLLRARLLSYRSGQAPSRDTSFTSIAYSSFNALWRASESLVEPNRLQEGRAIFSVRLRALCFLLLLEDDRPALPLLQPPFFTSETAQQAAAAAAFYEAKQVQSSSLLSRKLGNLLLATLREEASTPPTLQQCLCFFELTREQCRHLCKSGEYQDAQQAIKDLRDFVGAADNSVTSFGAPLSLLDAGVQLSWELAKGTGSMELFLPAAVVLGTAVEASERFLMLLAESCQFVISLLSESMKTSRPQLFRQEDVLGLCAFTNGHCRVLHRVLERIPSYGAKQKLLVKQLLYSNLQLFTSMVYDALQSSQLTGWLALEQLVAECGKSMTWMLDALEGLTGSERTRYLNVTVSCAFKLAYIFYNQNLHKEASSLCELLCKRLTAEDAYACPEIPPDKLHKCFRLLVESYRKLGQLERALECVVWWLSALQGRIKELLAEPVSLWARVKTDAAKQGNEELGLRTLKEGLKGHNLDPDTLVTVLFAELKAYKAIRADTGKERYNTLCDLLEICSEESGRLHERAFCLVELAQVLCYHSYPEFTECSCLDSIHEALYLLELVPRNTQNQDQLLDDQAQALLWLYICTLESKLEKSIERDQRVKAMGLKNPDDFETNDLNYESRQLEDRFTCDSICFNLVTETDLSKSLDDAFALWKQLLEKPGVPAVRSPEQTVASLQLLATIYKLMFKPFQALESYHLVRALCSRLGDSLGMARALCHITKLLFQLECPSYAKLFLEETESCLQEADSSNDSYPLVQQTCLLLRSQLCCVNYQIEEGVTLLLGVLQNPALRKNTKDWYLLRASILQLVAFYLSLPPASLSPELRQQIFGQGWKMTETALTEAHKLFRSIILVVMGSNVLGCQTKPADVQFLDYGENLLLKWEVLADLLACLKHYVALLSSLELVSRAKLFCFEAIHLAMRLQTTRWCCFFLMLKAQLELQEGEPELSHHNLQQALFLLESDTNYEAIEEQKGQTKVMHRERKRLAFLTHPAACLCHLCSDVVLSALCLRWLISHAQTELAEGSKAEGLGLIRDTLLRCTAVATRFDAVLRDKLQCSSVTRVPALELLDELVATGYATLALQSLGNPLLAEEMAEELETGLTFLASCRPNLPSLEVSRASLLLAKATRTIWHLASKCGDSVDGVFAHSWTWQLPTLTPVEPKASSVLQTLKGDNVRPQKSKTKTRVASAVPKTGTKKQQRAKAPAVPSADAFAPGDLDSEVTFSDDSQEKGPQVTPIPRPTRKTRSTRKALPSNSSGSQVSSRSSSTQLRRKRLAACRAGAAEEKKEQVTCRARGKKVEEDLDLSMAFEEERGDPGSSQLPRHGQKGADEEHEILRQEDCTDVLAMQRLDGGNPVCLEGTLSTLPGAADVSLLDTVVERLKEAFNCISHCPPGALYRQLCLLLALAMGDHDPLATAYLLSESISITIRHQMLSIIPRKIHKEQKSVRAVAEQLRGLSLQEQSTIQCSPRLAELEGFMFSSTGLGPEVQDDFQRQLQQIPSGVTVCMLTLASIQLGSVGETLLLTRLEKDMAPVTIRIPKVPLHSLLSEFESILKEQKQVNNCTDNQAWWLRRSELDCRMKSIIDTMETQVLGCWRSALIPSGLTQPRLAKEAAQLSLQLRQYGWRDSHSSLLQVLLKVAPFLTPEDVQALAFGLCPAQPHKAQLLLQKAVGKKKACAAWAGGSLVLVLDRVRAQLLFSLSPGSPAPLSPHSCTPRPSLFPASAKAALGVHGVLESCDRNQAPLPALPAQLFPGTEETICADPRCESQEHFLHPQPPP
ncbi:separin isoform X1 [Cuculus canorus]|uniref:separin isoform X1 n=1 Tax=Cuculus canorus TaxID=55661 RepID=UPI0023AA2D3C|nr:separin isoform X1 [Cuculus canorus]